VDRITGKVERLYVTAGLQRHRIDSPESEGIAGAPIPVPDRVDDSRELPPGDLIVRDRDAEDLARALPRNQGSLR